VELRIARRGSARLTAAIHGCCLRRTATGSVKPVKRKIELERKVWTEEEKLVARKVAKAA
jgi:hypothetical protein